MTTLLQKIRDGITGPFPGGGCCLPTRLPMTTPAYSVFEIDGTNAPTGVTDDPGSGLIFGPGDYRVGAFALDPNNTLADTFLNLTIVDPGNWSDDNELAVGQEVLAGRDLFLSVPDGESYEVNVSYGSPNAIGDEGPQPWVLAYFWVQRLE